jgi:histidinol-phosphate aminotransferase
MISEKPLVPKNIERLQPYVAGKTIAEVKERYNPARISKLASNENRLGCSPKVKEAVLKALGEIQDYPDPVSRKLRQMIADRNGVKPENVIVAAGSESLIAILCRTFFLDDENAVTADATFVGFFVQAGVRGIELKKVPLTGDYRFDVDGLLEAVDHQTKMIYIANPNNPTGTYINKDEYLYLLKQLPDDLMLINDEAYFEYARQTEDYPAGLDYDWKNVIVLRTFSKAYGLAGCRVGYAIADADLISEMMKTKLTFEPSATAQAAAAAAYEDEAFLEKSLRVVEKGRKRLYKLFDSRGIEYTPSVSNSVMMVLDNEEMAKTFTQKMLETGVILRRTHLFGIPNAIRITIGTEEEMDHFEKSFHQVLASM